MTGVRALRIDPDGSVTRLDEFAWTAGQAEFDHTTVVTCGAPFVGQSVHVLVLDDFGAADLPLNRKAWGLYGRSPIYGPVFVGRDDGDEVDEELAATVEAAIGDWPIPSHVAELLTTDNPSRPGMLADRPTGAPE